MLLRAHGQQAQDTGREGQDQDQADDHERERGLSHGGLRYST